MALPAHVLMLCASLLFALMAVCVKFASADYGSGEIVLYRSVIGLPLMAVVLRPTIAQDPLWHGLYGLLGGMLAAAACLQVNALRRAGEPEERVVFCFSLAGVVSGLLLALATAAQWMMTPACTIRSTLGSTLGVAALQCMGIVYSFALGVWLLHDPVTASSLAGARLPPPPPPSPSTDR